MKRASYRDAIKWLAHNDDNEWLDDDYGLPSVAACLVADLFGAGDEKVKGDIVRQLERM
jgi:hypothetical protein